MEKLGDIKRVYTKHYKNLLTQNKTDTERENEVEEIVEQHNKARRIMALDKKLTYTLEGI